MNIKRITYKFRAALVLTLALTVLLAGCAGGGGDANTADAGVDTSDTSVTPSDTGDSGTSDATLASLGLDVGLADAWDGTADASVVFTDSQATVDGSGAVSDGTTVTITAGGDYLVSGRCSDGQILVDSSDNVTLVLNGLDLTCAASAPIYVKSAKNATVFLASGTENALSDGEGFSYSDAEKEEPNATVFSKDDLYILGDGALTVTAVFNNGIQSKDDLVIQSGSLTVTAANDAVKGKDSVVITGGTLTLKAGEDGICATNTEDAGRGYIAVTGGTVTVTAGNDGLQAANAVNITGGVFDITTGGGAGEFTVNTGMGGSGRPGGGRWGGDWSKSSSSDEESAKGIKAETELNISGGTFTLDCADDALHSNGDLTVSGGTVTAATGDDGLHADDVVTVSSGSITVTQSKEGIEGHTINQSGGKVDLTASDDGYNATSGDGGKGLLNITGGTVHVNAYGDGLDSNGSATMTGGMVTVSGPTDNGNGALDYDLSFTVSGGTLVACGSAGMAMSVSSEGDAAVIAANVGAIAADTTIGVIDADGSPVIFFTPEKTYSTVVFASDLLTGGAVYTVAYGGTVTDGVWTGYSALGELTAGK